MMGILKKAMELNIIGVWHNNLAFPLARRFDYSKIAQSFISVQPLSRPAGSIFSLKDE